MANIKHIDNYTNVMKQWGKELGPKPTEANLALAHVFGRPGKQSFIVALALRDAGVTRGQMLNACALFDGKATPQLNHMRALIAAKMFSRDTGHTGYKLTQGPKAQAFIDLHGAKAVEKAAAKPDKAPAKKRTSKPRKAAGEVAVMVPAETATVEQPTA
jgi:hypothetical protein